MRIVEAIADCALRKANNVSRRRSILSDAKHKRRDIAIRNSGQTGVLSAFAVGLAAAYAMAAGPAHAQQSEAATPAAPVMERGNAAVTAFSGTITAKKTPKGAHPLDVTFIDPDGKSLRVFDLSELGGPPQGQLIGAKEKFSVTARQIGQVFGVAQDSGDNGEAPNIYVGATSLYGLHILTRKSGQPIRLVYGAPEAEWMPGQFATDLGGGPGSIWKIDGQTGAVSLFTEVLSGNQPNAGPGLGGLAYDPVTKQLYATSLETGFVHRFNETGRDLGFFDHGTQGRTQAGLEAIGYDGSRRMDIKHPSFNIEKPETWGYADKKRMVVALAIHKGRLYYSVSEGPQVWSVGLDTLGGFLDDARSELDLLDTPTGSMITDIAFDRDGRLYVTQRGDLAGTYDYSTFAEPQSAVVVRYAWDEEEQRWAESTQEFAVGLGAPHRATNGGIALGYGYDENGRAEIGKCRETLWTTGERLRLGAPEGPRIVHGLQGISTASGQDRAAWRPSSGASALNGEFARGVTTELTPPTQSWFLDKDGTEGDEHAYGHLGSIAINAPCDGESFDDTRPEGVETPLVEGPDFFPDIVEEIPDGWVPPEGIPPIFPPPGFPGLDITKVCNPSAFGGVISCTITLTNTGTIFYDDPVVVTDASTIAAGPGAGGVIDIAAVTPDAPGWTCTPTPANSVSCGLPPELLGPGVSRSFVVDVDTGGLIAGGNTGFQNCASVGAPFWGIACDSGGTDITVKKTVEPGCTAGNDCTFTLEISNGATTPFNGDIQLTDEMFRNNAGPAVNAPITAIAGDLGCAVAPGAIPFSCQSTMSLAAGETRTINITATMPPAPPANYWLRNCFAATAPGVVPAGLMTMLPPGGGSLGSGGAVSCAWVQVGAPALHANLRMQKSAQACGKLPGDENTVNCDYTITILNTGPSDFNAPIDFDETVDPPTATLISNDPAWTCGGVAPNYSCGSGGANVTIAAGASVSIPVSIREQKLVVEAAPANCTVTNSVQLTNPLPNPATNFDPTDDSAQAFGDAWFLEFDENGAAIILCDPTNLKTTQVAKGPCEKDGDRWRCLFDIFVTNTGPDPYKGIITLVDQMSIAPISVKQTGPTPWGQKAGAGGFVFGLPKQTLPKGETVKLGLEVEIPDGNHCSLTNIAHMTFPVLDRHNGDKTDDTAMATAKIPRPECNKPPQCRPKEGEFRTKSGACACKPEYIRENNGQCRKPDRPEPPPLAKCPDSSLMPSDGNCACPDGERWDKDKKVCIGEEPDKPDDVIPPPPPPQKCVLKPGQVRNKSGDCVCPNGRTWTKATNCAACAKGDKACLCKLKGLPYNTRTGKCGDDIVPPPPPPPPPACTLKPGQVYDDVGNCVCPNGRNWTRATHCSPCKKSDIACLCKVKGLPYNAKLNRCGPSNPPPVCKDPDTYQASPGICCRIGEVLRRGRCVPGDKPTDPKDECLKKGWWWVNNTCKRPCKSSDIRCQCELAGKPYNPRTRTCGTDTTQPDPKAECLKKGWRWTGSICVPPPKPDDAKAECLKKGWWWLKNTCVRPCKSTDIRCQCKLAGKPYNRKTNSCGSGDESSPDCVNGTLKKGRGGDWYCQCRRGYTLKAGVCQPNNDGGSNGKDACLKKGWRWTGRVCLPPATDPAKECRAKGGRWNGKRCITGPTPAELCARKGGRWNGKRCITGPTPAQLCAQKGGRWNGKSCITGPTPAQLCAQKGGRWNGKSCITGPTPAQLCAKKGGRWNGKSCITGPTPAQLCARKGGRWNGKSCITGPTPAQLCARKGGRWNGKRCITGPTPAQLCARKGGRWTGKRCITKQTLAPKKQKIDPKLLRKFKANKQNLGRSNRRTRWQK